MISETILLWLGTIALLADYVALAKADNRESKAIALLFALVFWIGFTMNSLGYARITETGTVLTRSSQSLQLIGILALVSTLALLFESVFGLFKN